MVTRAIALRRVKVIHTVAWAFFAGCVVAIPVLAGQGQLKLAAWAIAVVMFESMILVVNRWRCPLTDLAARYTLDRQDNFDIYLPLWLARYNKQIFGPAFGLGILYTLAVWRGWL